MGVSPLTVRRAVAAARFAARLADQGRIDGRGALDGVPVTLLETLGRIERFSPAEVDRLIPQLLIGNMQPGQLARSEAALRQAALGKPAGEAGESSEGRGYSRRMRSRTMRLALLERLADELRIFGNLRIVPQSDFPLRQDAVADRSPGKPGPVRVLIQIRPDSAAESLRTKVADAAAHALAAARIFDEVWVVVERLDEAEMLAAAIKGLSPWTGIGILSPTAERAWTFVLSPQRISPPDMVQYPAPTHAVPDETPGTGL